jgi:aerobic carbon-monoxide dehydrogenase medium subunit
MKPAAFEYVRANSVAEAVQLLASLGEGARLIAGGQSLLPALNFRFILPSHLIDIGGIAELRGISITGSGLRIGACTRHAELLKSELIARHVPLIAKAISYVAHPAIRNRGTIGGNLAHADPASELPACVVALDATLIAAGPRGERRIAAPEFFQGLYETALKPDEILTAIDIPARPASEKSYFQEFARRLGDYAMVGLACVARLDGRVFKDIRPVYFGVGDKPVMASECRALILGAKSIPSLAALRAALAKNLAPQDDLQASGEMRLHLAAVLLHRCIVSLTTEEKAA